MKNELIETITNKDDTICNRSINSLLQNKNKDELLKCAEELEVFRKTSTNLYHKVRALLFLFVLYRFYLQMNEEVIQHGKIPFEGVKAALGRDFEKSIEIYLKEITENCSYNSAIFSAIADSYHRLSFKYLLDQVKLSISYCNENFHLFNIKGLNEYPYSVPAELIISDPASGLYPVGFDASPVRLDPSHSGWSDIFFLGMDFPEGARVVNISVDLKIHGSEGDILPPCECYCRYIEEPLIRLTSVDLKTSKDITTIEELFNFGNDYLSLLKAGVVASGIVPPCFEKTDIFLNDLLQKLLNKHGGIEIVTRVNNIPKGSRLAVSTTLLSTIITRLMRFSGQIKNQTGSLTEEERRTVVSRAILGEWLGGSGGGWQDSGGLWPGIKVITGRLAKAGDPECGVSRGCLLPEHKLFTKDEVSEDIEERIINSMVLVHGGISQDVGPILEMVTEKYLLKYEKEWDARLKGIRLFDKIVHALKCGDMKELGRLTTLDWEESIQKVIPWVNNAFTNDLINKIKEEFRDHYWGFLMLGGMSGGGMAFIVDPQVNNVFKKRILEIMNELKNIYNNSFPFIIDPVVYDFKFNHDGIVAQLLKGSDAKIPALSNPTTPSLIKESEGEFLDEEDIKNRYGFDYKSHGHMKSMLKIGDIGLSKNRLPLTTKIEDVKPDEVFHFDRIKGNNEFYKSGMESLKSNEAAVVTFAGGIGSRWTHGAAVVKPISPFIEIEGKYRTFIESHLAKSRKTGEQSGHRITHIFTTSYLTHNAIQRYLERFNYFNYEGQIYLSPAKTIGRRVYPMERDLRFYWNEQLQQKQDENIQKLLDDTHKALIEWAKSRGEGEDYSENKPILRFNPPGHWYEIPNLIKNGTLGRIITENPNLKYLLCHNIDTLGTHIEPALLGMHISNQSCLTFEVTPRRIEDKGGGLAKINGRIQLIEGLALPREEDEYKSSYYNTLTNWITIDELLEYFGIDRNLTVQAEKDLSAKNRIIEAIQSVERKIPTYVTIKNVKQVWGIGQEDIYLVAQFEKLWGDMTQLKDLKVNYAVVSRYRGQQLKEPSQLYMWTIDGSFEYLKSEAVFT
ncbi:MAG: UTP--glucose-1-phosphate uridylyltransferase [Nitrospirae bacterium]|nr:UTP--glucose-1-phosphate uridylyltransferase [Nitrospirota bacterium]